MSSSLRSMPAANQPPLTRYLPFYAVTIGRSLRFVVTTHQRFQAQARRSYLPRHEVSGHPISGMKRWLEERTQSTLKTTPPPTQHGYPPDKQAKATETVVEQAALLSAEWAIA